MILSVRPLYSGNALQVFLQPLAGADAWRLLRKPTNDFTDQNDPNALLAYEGTDRAITDAEPGLINEVPVYYKPYYLVNGVWTAAAAVSGTPQATYADQSTDVMRILRDRLEAGLKVEVARGTFVLPGGRDTIAVLTSPPLEQMVQLPVVTIHQSNAAPETRAVGEEIMPDTWDAELSEWKENQGFLESIALDVVGWSLNPDERIELRKAIRRVLVANFEVFDAAGMVQIGYSATDIDAISGEYSANIFQSVFNFTCQAPVIVTQPVPTVNVVNAAPANPAPFN